MYQSKFHSQLRSAAANYKRLIPFIDAADALPDRHYTFHCGESMMPLSVEYLGYEWEGCPVYSLMHWYTQCGDLMRDPDMTVAVARESGRIIPLTFQQDGALPVYHEAFPEPGKFRPAVLKDLDSFLSSWSRNIIAQGYSPDEPKRPVTLDEFAARYAAAE